MHTRFPPEPNGYLHIGHAKAICLSFGVALEFGGKCNLRFDDTNPAKEDVEYVDAIREDVHWLGFDWDGREFYASDYFEQLYLWAEELIQKGLAYVDNLTPDEVREHRGTLTEPGRESPYRNRPVAENLDLFRRMRAGEFEDGSYTLRAKIDMASPNINMRDPALYRIRRVAHHRTGDAWCIYPMYDFAHALSDAIEGITHSLCTLEFEDHRPLYDWCVANCTVPSVPRQIEFARLNLTYTVMSKRRLLSLVQEGVVDGWDDPRMPTISGLRRRGYTPGSDPRVRRAHRRREAREPGGRRPARGRGPRRPEQARAEGHGRPQAAESGDRELPGGPGRDDLAPAQPRPPGGRHRARSRSRASSTSSATTSWRSRRRSSSASPRAAKSGCAAPTSSRASGW